MASSKCTFCTLSTEHNPCAHCQRDSAILSVTQKQTPEFEAIRYKIQQERQKLLPQCTLCTQRVRYLDHTCLTLDTQCQKCYERCKHPGCTRMRHLTTPAPFCIDHDPACQGCTYPGCTSKKTPNCSRHAENATICMRDNCTNEVTMTSMGWRRDGRTYTDAICDKCALLPDPHYNA
jgi:hypothetical protein